MKSIFLLVTDGSRAMMIHDPILGNDYLLPSHQQWPKTLKPSKNEWPLHLVKHVTYNIPFQWPEYQKQKKTFGMPEHSSWFLFSITQPDFDYLLRETKKVSQWFFRYANASIPWTIKSFDLTILNGKTNCDAMSAHCLRAYLEKIKVNDSSQANE